MEFSYSQTENFEMEKLSSDTGYSKKTVEINRGPGLFKLPYFLALDVWNLVTFEKTSYITLHILVCFYSESTSAELVSCQTARFKFK